LKHSNFPKLLFLLILSIRQTYLKNHKLLLYLDTLIHLYFLMKLIL
jgi:hypothetical protein